MNHLPVFPDFVQIDVSHKQSLRAIADNLPPYSDFNFVSMFTWDIDDSLELTTLNENMVVRFGDYSSGESFLSLLGTNDVVDTIDTLFDYCRQHGLKPELKLVGEAVIDSLSDEDRMSYIIEEDRDNHDYILSAVNMSDLAKLHPKKRTKHNRFLTEYGDKSMSKELDLGLESTTQEIRQLMAEWKLARGRDDSDTVREFTAINRCLDYASDLDVLGYGIYVDDKLVAFTLFEIINGDSAMLHFGKADISLKGSNEYLQHHLAKHLKGLGVEHMNNEQDLGIEGLRKSKQSSLPVHFLKKYTITVA
ncbi:MAG: phosphatidylglycerol lysyltransferase domain-containing protein [Patescibacteria group bacterium]